MLVIMLDGAYMQEEEESAQNVVLGEPLLMKQLGETFVGLVLMTISCS